MTHDEIYRGLIIQNNDPTNSGRVKVFVPGINITQTKDWNKQKAEDKFFKVLGKNTNTSITTDILQNQKDKLFWAEVMLPIMGPSAPGTYHAPTDTYYIGNDSDYLFQEGNKSDAAFAEDAAEARRRENGPIQNPPYGIPPRINTLLNFPKTGSKFSFNTGCSDGSGAPSSGGSGGNSNSTASIWKSKNGVLQPIIDQLPTEYTYEEPDLDAPNVDEETNNSVTGVSLNVMNPTIFLNGVKIPSDNPIYNNSCYSVPSNSDSVSYSPPITFEDDVDGTPTKTYEALPVSIFVNGKDTLNSEFILESSDDESLVYSDGSLKLIVPKKDILGVNIKNNGNYFDFSKIKNIAPIANPSADAPIIMPRAPISNGQPLMSRGGGGSELFNNVISKMLPSFMKKDAHVGGANNESRQTVNKGRKPSNDKNNTKGCNLVGDCGQVHRGPMRVSDYNNQWKGMTCIPSIGSHVWVRFENGDSNYAIIIGTYADQANYKGIFKMP